MEKATYLWSKPGERVMAWLMACCRVVHGSLSKKVVFMVCIPRKVCCGGVYMV